jgi:hypothetical protein
VAHSVCLKVPDVYDNEGALVDRDCRRCDPKQDSESDFKLQVCGQRHLECEIIKTVCYLYDSSPLLHVGPGTLKDTILDPSFGSSKYLTHFCLASSHIWSMGSNASIYYILNVFEVEKYVLKALPSGCLSRLPSCAGSEMIRSTTNH